MRGSFHVEFLQRLGLTPRQTVLDFGCGYGRTSIPLTRYLDADRHIGVDSSEQRIEMAHEWVEREGLSDKRPRFLAKVDDTLSWLSDESIDVIFTCSVFTHVPEGVMRDILAGFRRVLRPDSYILFSFSESSSDRLERPTIKDFRYPAAVVYRALNKSGYTYEQRPDWDDDLEDGRKSTVSRMLKVSKKEG